MLAWAKFPIKLMWRLPHQHWPLPHQLLPWLAEFDDLSDLFALSWQFPSLLMQNWLISRFYDSHLIFSFPWLSTTVAFFPTNCSWEAPPMHARLHRKVAVWEAVPYDMGLTYITLLHGLDCGKKRCIGRWVGTMMEAGKCWWSRTEGEEGHRWTNVSCTIHSDITHEEDKLYAERWNIQETHDSGDRPSTQEIVTGGIGR